MDLKINDYQIPSTIDFNFEAIRAEVSERADYLNEKIYSTEMLKEAKSDRANINRFTKALNDKRIALQREYLKPFNEFKAKIDELIAIANEPKERIDAWIKSQEEANKPSLKVDTSKWYTFELLLDDKKLLAFEKFLAKNEIECVAVTKTLVTDTAEE